VDWAIGQSGNRAIGQSGNRAIGQSGNYTPLLNNRVNYLTAKNYPTDNFLIPLEKRRSLSGTAYLYIKQERSM